ncbi:uncharacterized protein Pyn_13202 [Prunus yedoensis var. nudiflora]|uniref:Uncharacterized protein n=1 Tax=Prunus yedoensis var. nudiflora TaxID=2094558 RepID=A0A314UJF4_PRUYE|nr:uncharacterized protein Pyn_13202 [Prunus yedoensis var. nudiflora]
MTGKGLEIREYWSGAPEGAYVVAIRLRPREHKEIPATKFRDAIVDSCNRGMVIKVTIDGSDFQTLLAQEFIFNIKLTFIIEANGKLAVTKLKSDQTLKTELTRIFKPTRLRALFRRPTMREPDQSRDIDDHQEEASAYVPFPKHS